MTRPAYEPRRARHWASVNADGQVMVHTDMGTDLEVRRMVRMAGRRIIVGPCKTESRLMAELCRWRRGQEQGASMELAGKEQTNGSTADA